MNINQKNESKLKNTNQNVGTCLRHVSMATTKFSVKTHWKHAEGMSIRYGVIFFRYGWGQKNPLRGGCHTGGDI